VLRVTDFIGVVVFAEDSDMSLVTDIVLLTSIAECGSDPITDEILEPEGVTEINKWLLEHRHAPLKKVTKFAGGEKVMETIAFMGGYSGLDATALGTYVLTRSWLEPSNVLLITHSPGAAEFTILPIA
jgi:hypothetical protein